MRKKVFGGSMRLVVVGFIMVFILVGCGTDGDTGPQGEQGPSGTDAVFSGTDAGTANLLIALEINGESTEDCLECENLFTEYGISFFTYDVRDENDVPQCSASVSSMTGYTCNDIPAGIYSVRVTANSGFRFTGPEIAFRKQSIVLSDGDYAEVRVGFSTMDFD